MGEDLLPEAGLYRATLENVAHPAVKEQLKLGRCRSCATEHGQI
jgi:hypothetical protein